MASKAADKAHEGTEGFFARLILFVKQVIGELKKVVWPTFSEWKSYFIVVLMFVLAIMIFTGVLDLVFGYLSVWVFG